MIAISMKKFCVYLLITAILLPLFSLCLPVLAAAPTATLKGATELRAGDVFTVTLRINGTNLRSIQGSITYDSEKITYSSSKVLISGWDINVTPTDGSVNFLGIDDQMSAPITKDTKILSLTFKAKSTLSAGTSLKITAKNLNASDGTADFSIANAQYSNTISPPKSSDATLSKLQAGEASLMPDFSPDVTEYTAATIPFAVNSLTLTAKANHKNASVKISGNENLSVGENVIKITVTAENGSTKIYTIRVEREQDPNYIPSSDAALSDLTTSYGKLSPTFDPTIKSYLLVVPFEVQQITLTGTPHDPLAIGCSEQTIHLDLGENILSYTNIAEDGGEETYTVTVLRLDKYEGTPPLILPGEGPESETQDAQTDPDPAESDPLETTPAPSQTNPTPRDPNDADIFFPMQPKLLIAFGVTAVVMLGIGLCIGILCTKPKRYRYKN